MDNITSEEFFRTKVKELQPNKEVVALCNELITAEQGLRWAKEYSDLYNTDNFKRIKELENDAIEFAEWISDKSYIKSFEIEDNGKYTKDWNIFYMINELYTEFKNKKTYH